MKRWILILIFLLVPLWGLAQEPAQEGAAETKAEEVSAELESEKAPVDQGEALAQEGADVDAEGAESAQTATEPEPAKEVEVLQTLSEEEAQGEFQEERKTGPMVMKSVGVKELATSPPQILSDLSQRQILLMDTLDVDFVLVDQDKIVKVEINGADYPIKPASTVSITKRFKLNPGVSRVLLTATDEEGNSQTKSWLLVYRPKTQGVKTAGFTWNFLASVAQITDSNPTLDLSSPIDISDEIDLQGVVDDSEQADNLQKLLFVVVVTKDNYHAVLGRQSMTYSKADYDELSSAASFLTLGYAYKLSPSSRINLGLGSMDFNVGGFDYQQLQQLNASWEIKSKDYEGSSTHRFGWIMNMKSFASDEQQDASEQKLQYTYESLDADELDLFRMILGVGNSSEGTDESQHSFVSGKMQWKNRWASGLKLDFELSAAKKDYPNDVPLVTDTPLGEARVDMPIGYGGRLAYKYKKMQVSIDYEYQFNFSNKLIYERTLSGISLEGWF